MLLLYGDNKGLYGENGCRLVPSLQYKSLRNTKALKALDAKRSFVLERDVYMDKVEALCSRALAGRLEYCKMGKEDWVAWATKY